MKYTVNDIIKRALVIADMDGSDVISYEQTNNYLNQAWRNVVQKAINAGIKYFYSEVEVTCGWNDLPWDFYQIDSIQSRYGWTLPKHNRADPENFPSYDIIGNKLFVYGSIVPSLKMMYWKKPITLTFPNKKINIDDIPTYDVMDMYDTKMVYAFSGQVHIYDVREKIDTELPDTFDSINKIFCGRGCFYVEGTVGLNELKIVSSYRGKQIISNQEQRFEDLDLFPIFLEDESISLFYTDESEHKIYVFDWKKNTILEFGYPATYPSDLPHNEWAEVSWLANGVIYHAASDDNGNWFIIKVTEDEYSVYGKGRYIRKTIFEDTPAILTDQSIIWENDDAIFEEPLDVENKVLAVLKGDFKTGYGLLTTDGTDYYIESYMPDTLLDFPSALMFDYLAYSLAYYYSLRLNVDMTNITEAVENAEHLFLDSLDQNADYPLVVDVSGASQYYV